ncbi:unnamed protein product [Symbiodinium natans]|uniref:Uncharacterized protein n=1 Tax=Symbiodinium natans TaxID=878477 RepID=A0A812RGH5_9DINO|nr:unnamed protein product [Symbiodinium natans]
MDNAHPQLAKESCRCISVVVQTSWNKAEICEARGAPFSREPTDEIRACRVWKLGRDVLGFWHVRRHGSSRWPAAMYSAKDMIAALQAVGESLWAALGRSALDACLRVQSSGSVA